MPTKKQTEEVKQEIVKRKVVQSKNTPMPYVEGMKGFEEIGQEDMLLPRVKLVQKQSGEIDDYEDIKPGNLINSITKEFVADPKKNILEFIPLGVYKTRIKWIPFSDGGGIDCRSDDGIIGNKYGSCFGCEFAEFDKEGAPPLCTLIYNYPSIILGVQEDFPISISMYKTSTGVAKQLNAMVKLAQASGKLECYSNVYTLGTAQQEKEGQKYYVLNVRGSNTKVTKEQMKKLDSLYNLVKLARQAGKMQVDLSDIEEEERAEDNDKEF